MTAFHEEYDIDGDPILFRCTECGEHYLSIGAMHAHAHGHESILRFLYHQIPFVGDSFELGMRKTEVLRVTKTDKVEFDDWE